VVDESGKGNFTSLNAVYSSKVKPGDILYMRGTAAAALIASLPWLSSRE
jgi:hypothetical protein